MSISNVEHEIRNTNFPTSSATPTKVINLYNATYGSECLLAYVEPSSNVSTENTGSGFGKGCLMIDITNGKLYKNTGTVSVASFTEITS